MEKVIDLQLDPEERVDDLAYEYEERCAKEEAAAAARWENERQEGLDREARFVYDHDRDFGPDYNEIELPEF
ncbi:MAG TPA: hypothetical protein VMX79_10125 [bacterium]|nr:hypothetical protein [bacterium]HUV87455.1 hypothetical protein [bacterium]